MPGKFYDVIIVGAGPAGSYVAYALASLGHSVAVLEKKSVPGLDACCTGIISTECFDSFGISPDIILTRANSAKFFSPSGKCLKLATQKVQAYVVDRASFDQAIAGKAQAVGAEYFFSFRVTDIAIEKEIARVETLCRGAEEIFTARAVILASGFRSQLSQKLGLGQIKHFFVGAQAEIEIKNLDEVEIYFGQQIAPGFFAWLVPISPDKCLAGLLSKSQAKLYLKRFLTGPFCRGRIVSQGATIRQKAMPLGILPRTYGNRILVIGDTAGQVKPTTGGGIFFGHLGAKIAAEVLHEALDSDELGAARLSDYQRRWKAKMGKEISLGYRARQIYARLGDDRIEQVFDMLNSGGIARALVNSPDFSFDWHRKLILAGLQHGLTHLLPRMGRPLSREARL